MKLDVYGIGNPLIDIITSVEEHDIISLNKNKNGMHLIDEQERTKILEYINTNDKIYECGGSCPNTIITLNQFGCKAAISGKVGNDEYGSIYIKNLKKSNTISDITQIENKTGSSIILLTPDSERTMNTYLGVNRSYLPDDVNEKLLQNSTFLYFTGYMWDTENQKEAILKAIRIAEKNNIKIVFDVADPFAVSRNKDDFLKLIKNHISIVFTNQQEAEMLCKSSSSEENIKKLSKLTDTVCLKLGSEGSLLYSENEIHKISIKPVTAIDTTGAGDIFAAGFLYGLIKGTSNYTAALLASYAAGQIVKIIGAQFAHEQIDRIIKDLSEIIKKQPDD